MDDVVEVIGIEHLKVILSGLSPEEIIRPAYENWQTCMKTGYTRLNLETGEIYGVGVELNDLPLPSTIYIELYKIDAYDEPISEDEFFSQSEYDKFLEFSASEPSEYIPDIISEFCQINGIDEDKRKIGILAYNFEKKERSNYNMWESSVLNKYYDAIYEDHNPFMFSQNSL